MWIAMPWRPRAHFSRASFRALGSFTAGLLGSRLFFYLQRYADNLVVGRGLGAAALGAYALAYNLMMLPFQRVVDPLRNALFPALSRTQDDLPRLRGLWMRSTRAVTALFMPMLFGLIVVADDLVRVVLGDHWLVAVAPIRILALVGVLQSLIGLNSLVLMALGRAGSLLRFSIVAFALSLAGFLAGVQWGVSGVAAGYLVATAAIVPLYLTVAARAMALRLRELALYLARVFQAALGMLVIVVAVKLGLGAIGAPALLCLCVCTVTGAAAAVALLAWREPALRDDARAAWRALRPNARA
jgi:O-antigen/teichoic acid export membrane protein